MYSSYVRDECISYKWVPVKTNWHFLLLLILKYFNILVHRCVKIQCRQQDTVGWIFTFIWALNYDCQGLYFKYLYLYTYTTSIPSRRTHNGQGRQPFMIKPFTNNGCPWPLCVCQLGMLVTYHIKYTDSYSFF